MVTINFTGKIRNYKLTLDEPEKFKTYVKSLNKADNTERLITLTLKKTTKPRSNNQNSYYFGVVVKILADHIGYTPEEMHEALKFQMLLDRTGELPIVRSTTDLSTVEMEDYLRRCREFASIEFQCVIPLPNETEFDYSLA